MGEGRGACRVLVRKPEARRPRGSLVVYKNIILEWIFKKIVSEGVDWIDLTRINDRLCTVVNKVMNVRVA